MPAAFAAVSFGVPGEAPLPGRAGASVTLASAVAVAAPGADARVLGLESSSSLPEPELLAESLLDDGSGSVGGSVTPRMRRDSTWVAARQLGSRQ